MQSFVRIALLSVVLLGYGAVPVLGSTITWNFGGLTNADVFSIPANSYLLLSWTFDSAAPNLCAGTNGEGVYQNQSVTMTFAGRTYQSLGGLLLVHSDPGCNFQGGSFSDSVFVNFGAFTGPDLSDASLYRGTDTSLRMRLVVVPSRNPFPQNGGIPTDFAAAFVQGPIFYDNAGRALISTTVSTPEPATWLLLGTGLAAVAARRQLTKRA